MPDSNPFRQITLNLTYKCKKDKDVYLGITNIYDKKGKELDDTVETLVIQTIADVPKERWESLHWRLSRVERKYEKELNKYMGSTPCINDYIDRLRQLEMFNRMIALGMFGKKGLDYIPTIILEITIVRIMLYCINPELKEYLDVSYEYDYAFMSIG